jgi:hypothetical protein
MQVGLPEMATLRNNKRLSETTTPRASRRKPEIKKNQS